MGNRFVVMFLENDPGRSVREEYTALYFSTADSSFNSLVTVQAPKFNGSTVVDINKYITPGQVGEHIQVHDTGPGRVLFVCLFVCLFKSY